MSKKTKNITGGRPEEDLSGITFIPPKVRRYILQAIGEYKTDTWIVAELKKRWNITRSETTIKQIYRYNRQYEDQIQKYRDKFNSEAGQEPTNSKRYMLQRLNEALDKAIHRNDFTGVAAITKQIREITGMKTAETVDINHTVSGGLTYEKRIFALVSERQTPPNKETLTTTGNLPALQTIEVKNEKSKKPTQVKKEPEIQT